jgi:hypothetical protein
MPIYSLQYYFRQSLAAPARAAYAWCTDYEPEDGKLFPVKYTRSIRWLSEDALVLTDATYPGGHARRIHRLVRLNPSELAWTSTHIDGPYRHSQYWYRIVPDGRRRCHLDFQGFGLITSRRSLSKARVARLAAEERRSDARLWRRRISQALKRDLAPRARRSRGSKAR